MANVDKAFGLRPYKGLNVGSAVQEANKYDISTSGYGTSIFQGDLVIFAGGYINRAAASSANLVGVFSHCYYVATDGTPTFKNYYPASTTALGSGAIEAYIYDDPAGEPRTGYPVEAYLDPIETFSEFRWPYLGNAVTAWPSWEANRPTYHPAVVWPDPTYHDQPTSLQYREDSSMAAR